MAILGLGTDIVEIARIEAVIARSGDRLARRVLSDHEWSIWEQHQQPVRFGETLCGQSGGESAGNRSVTGWRLTSSRFTTTSWASRSCGRVKQTF